MICNKNCKEHPLLINDSSTVVIIANRITAEEYLGYRPAADLSGVNIWDDIRIIHIIPRIRHPLEQAPPIIKLNITTPKSYLLCILLWTLVNQMQPSGTWLPSARSRQLKAHFVTSGPAPKFHGINRSNYHSPASHVMIMMAYVRRK